MLVGDVDASIRYTLIQKTSTLLRVPGVYDFEHLLGRRMGEYFSMLRRDAPFTGLSDVYVPFPVLTPELRGRLLDVAAVRYVAVSPSFADAARHLDMPRIPVEDPTLQVYLNRRALPRARWVPRVDVVPDAAALLRRLADGDDDLSTVALVEDLPPSGFRGSDAATATTGRVTFVTDDPEHVVLDVAAPERGFLVLADQYDGGWRATIAGVRVPIQRANYLFRLVEVPAGSRRVEFRYRPESLLLGAVVSAAALGGAGFVLARRPRQRRA
jgi:hypothetical protein